MNDEPDEAEKIASLPPDSAPGTSDAIGLTILPPDGREARLRALLTLFFHEAGLDPVETTIAALAATAHRLGYALVPIRR